MPYCEKCGSPLDAQANFCGKCGASKRQTPSQPAAPQAANVNYMPPPPPPPSVQPQPQPAPTLVARSPQATGEGIVGVIVLRKHKSLGRYDSYTGVVTTQRFIFAQMTSAMLTEAVQQARDQAKSDGKGFWGQWSDQLKASFGYAKRYLNMAPEAILAETPGNFQVYNNMINELKLHLKDLNTNQHEFELKIKTNTGTFEFRMDENSDFTNLLKQVYGDKVKMPFGYFSNKGVRLSVGFR